MLEKRTHFEFVLFSTAILFCERKMKFHEEDIMFMQNKPTFCCEKYLFGRNSYISTEAIVFNFFFGGGRKR